MVTAGAGGGMNVVVAAVASGILIKLYIDGLFQYPGAGGGVGDAIGGPINGTTTGIIIDGAISLVNVIEGV